MVKNAVAEALLQVYSSCIAYALLPACELSVCFSVYFGTIPLFLKLASNYHRYLAPTITNKFGNFTNRVLKTQNNVGVCLSGKFNGLTNFCYK